MLKSVKSFLIISGEVSNATNDNNAWRSNQLFASLHDIKGVQGIIPSDGCYKGKTEHSFIVVLPEPYTDEFNTVKRQVLNLADEYGQECVLFRDNEGYCSLTPLANRKQVIDLGKWTEVSENDAKNCDAYTCVNNRYFISK
jgi:hypothetical protein